jgi:hypothetical protein
MKYDAIYKAFHPNNLILAVPSYPIVFWCWDEYTNLDATSLYRINSVKFALNFWNDNFK